MKEYIYILSRIADKLDTLGDIECEPPRADLYSFNGRLEMTQSLANVVHSNPHLATDITRGSSRALPLTSDHLLLRGSRIKNTEWAIGCAVYTGQHTKLAMNSRITRSKISSSETYINKFLVFFLVVLVSMVTVSYFMKRYDMFDCNHYPTSNIHSFCHFAFIQIQRYVLPGTPSVLGIPCRRQQRFTFYPRIFFIFNFIQQHHTDIIVCHH